MKPGSDGRARGEELDGVVLGERRDGVLLLAGDAQGLPARHDSRRLGQAASRSASSRCGLDHVLEVVEEQEQLLVGDVLGEAVLGSDRLRAVLEHERGSRSGASGTQKTPSG